MRIDISNVRLSNRINSNQTNEKSKDENKTNLKIGIGAQKNKKDDERLKLISNLEKIKDEYKEQKEKIMQMDLSPEDKKAKIKDITDKINETEGQIQEIKYQMQQEKVEEEKKKLEEKKIKEENDKQENNNKDIEKDGVVISKSLSDLIEAHLSISEIHELKAIKYKQKLEANYIQPSMNENSYDSKRLEQIAVSNTRIDGTVYRKIGKLFEMNNEHNKSSNNNADDKKSTANKNNDVSVDRPENEMYSELKKLD